jgi:pyruvate,water dikinase
MVTLGTSVAAPADETRPPAGPGRGPLVIDLRDDRALDAALVGAKAANLARAATAGLPVLPGVVLTTTATAGWLSGADPPRATLDALRDHVDGLPRRTHGPLVVRSSSTVEDAHRSSMAGRFRSVLGVGGWEQLVDAVRTVRDSAAEVARPGHGAEPIAVLIQPQLSPRWGGVLFGIDPVDGDDRHLVVEVVPGDPSDLVSGRATGTHLVLSRRGRVIEAAGPGGTLSRRERRALAMLARRAEAAFGEPLDIEWALDRDRRLWLLQSRPITAIGERPPTAGPILGPGPVAETFPAPLRRLEVELWVEPLREGIIRALEVTGAVRGRDIAGSPVVVAVGGWVAADLELLGVRRRRGRRLLPAAGLRRLLAAWRVGRLRAALPALAARLTTTVDDHLADVPALSDLATSELASLLTNIREELVSVHGYEVLAGMLLGDDPTFTPANAVALSVLTQARSSGQEDASTIAVDPVVLALSPPRIGGATDLPPTPSTPLDPAGGRLSARDALRLRARWLQEIGARATSVLGRRLAAAGRIPDAGLTPHLGLQELRDLVAGGDAPRDLSARAALHFGPPLPAEFRVTPSGAVVAVTTDPSRVDGLGAGGGRAVGSVRHRPPPLDSPEAVVLVVPTLDPGLATALPSVVGLVSETGSALSHLAILARELGIATVVGVPDAQRRFPTGARVLVDGSSGHVRRLDAETAGDAR